MYERGLGKQRSKLGIYLDEKKITQVDLGKESKISRNTIGDLASGNLKYTPSRATKTLIIRALKRMTGDESLTMDRFW